MGMEVYVLTWEVGLQSVHKRLIGIYNTFEKAKEEEHKYLKEHGFGECQIKVIPLNTKVDIVYLDI